MYTSVIPRPGPGPTLGGALVMRAVARSANGAGHGICFVPLDRSGSSAENPQPLFLLLIDVGRDKKLRVPSERLGSGGERGARHAAGFFPWEESGTIVRRKGRLLWLRTVSQRGPTSGGHYR